MNRYSYVYLLASHRNSSVYVGVTSDLTKRVWQHNIDRLVWFEQHESIESAIIREKNQKWNRAWKSRIIEATIPYWNDLYLELTA